MTMTKAQAEELWTKLDDAFADAERLLVEIVKGKAWEPLGYPSFVAAWNDRLKGRRLMTAAARAHVVYALLDDGLTADDVSAAVGTTISADGVARLERQHDLGVPADVASDRARPGERVAEAGNVSRPAMPRVLQVAMNPHQLAELRAAAEADGSTTLEDLARSLLLGWLATNGKAAA